MSLKNNRLAAHAAGLKITPCVGKRPILPEWQNRTDFTTEEVSSWRTTSEDTTGMVLGREWVFDGDILDPEAADLARLTLIEWFDGRGGTLPIRIGQAPKWA